MAERLQEALDAGAIGMSSGLAYAPAAHAPPAEIEALAALLRPAGALYTTHMRDEAEHVIDSLEESFAVGPRGRGAGGDLAPQDDRAATISAAPPRLCRRSPRRSRAQEVGLDAYPYIASSTVLSARAGRGGAEGPDHLVEERAGTGRPRT